MAILADYVPFLRYKALKTGTFTQGTIAGTPVTITDVDCKPNSFVVVMPTETQAGFWRTTAGSGSFTVTSTLTENLIGGVDFNYLIL